MKLTDIAFSVRESFSPFCKGKLAGSEMTWLLCYVWCSVGMIAALHGKETSAGDFLVEDVLEAGLPQQIERPIDLGIKYLTSLF